MTSRGPRALAHTAARAQRAPAIGEADGARLAAWSSGGIRTWGTLPVPWTVAWTGEDRDWRLALDPHARALAIAQAEAPGEGKPQFGKPHSQRQRRAIALCLCDLCGKSLRASTKVSLSHARAVGHSAGGWEVLQVEPMLHRACARRSLLACPSLKRDVADGSLAIRQVLAHGVQFALMDEVYVQSVTGEARKAVGHAKVQLRSWKDRDQTWLLAGAAA